MTNKMQTVSQADLETANDTHNDHNTSTDKPMVGSHRKINSNMINASLASGAKARVVG